MSNLVEELTKEHQEISQLLGRIIELGVASAQAQSLLMAARETLLNHLKKEDELLYPILRAAAQSNEDLQRTLDSFAQDMGEITQFALDYFQRHEADEAQAVQHGDEFMHETGRLLGVLRTRILREETILYPQFSTASHAG